MAHSDHIFGFYDEKLVALKLKYHPSNVLNNEWGAVTAAAVEKNHGYNPTMNLNPRQIAIEKRRQKVVRSGGSAHH